MIAWLKANASWVLAVLALCAAGYLGYGCRNERFLKQQEAVQVKSLTGRMDSLSRQLDAATKVVKHDSVVLVQFKTKYVVQRDTLLKHLTDTIEVVRFVQTADSTIHACQVLVTACEQRANLLQRQLLVTDSLNRVYKKLAPSLLQRNEWPIVAVTFVAGALVGHTLAK